MHSIMKKICIYVYAISFYYIHDAVKIVTNQLSHKLFVLSFSFSSMAFYFSVLPIWIIVFKIKIKCVKRDRHRCRKMLFKIADKSVKNMRETHARCEKRSKKQSMSMKNTERQKKTTTTSKYFKRDLTR